MAVRVEFQAVLMAGGRANALYPLTEEEPLSLLPLANRPLISFQLELLERSGFAEVLIVMQKSVAARMRSYLETYVGSLNIQLREVDDDLKSAEALLAARDAIHTDFLVLSGDLVSDRFIHHMADLHRVEDASVTALLTPMSQDEIAAITNDTMELDFIGLDASKTRLLYMSSAADWDDKIKLRKSLLKSQQSIVFSRTLRDGHMYIFKHWILDLLSERHFGSIKGDLVPYLIKKQFRLKKKENLADSIVVLENEETSVFDRLVRDQDLALSMTSSKAPSPDDVVRCVAYINEIGYCRRAHTLESYAQLNLDIATPGVSQYVPYEPLSKKAYIDESAEVSSKTQIGAQCVVGASTVVGDRCSIKKSNVGAHCHIGSNVKLVNSIVMNHVTIDDACVIVNCVVCPNVEIGEGAQLKDCKLGYGFKMEPGAEGEDNVFVNRNDR